MKETKGACLEQRLLCLPHRNFKYPDPSIYTNPSGDMDKLLVDFNIDSAMISDLLGLPSTDSICFLYTSIVAKISAEAS